MANGTALAVWSQDEIDLIKRTCVPGGELPPNDTFAVFMRIAKATGLDPFLGEIALVKRRSKDRDSNQWIETWQTMAKRDGYLSAAHRTGELRGVKTTVYPEDPTQPPTHATCSVWRAGWAEPYTATVSFAEYVQCKWENGRRVPMAQWADRPRTMIGKVAESQALRKVFSLHSTYTEEERPDEYDAALSLAPGAAVQQLSAQQDGAPAVAALPAETPAPVGVHNPATLDKLKRRARVIQRDDLRWNDDAFRVFCFNATGKESSKDWTIEDARRVNFMLDEVPRPTREPADDDEKPSPAAPVARPSTAQTVGDAVASNPAGEAAKVVSLPSSPPPGAASAPFTLARQARIDELRAMLPRLHAAEASLAGRYGGATLDALGDDALEKAASWVYDFTAAKEGA